MPPTPLDAAKPLPPSARGLDYLLAAPFRYRPYPQGSRFRRAGLSPGVWYGALQPETAAAEMAFYRLLFFAESPDTPFPANAGAYTGYAAALASTAAFDLTSGALAGDAARWTDRVDYAACQQLADDARAIACQLLYQSVRDPAGGRNVAVLDCAAFASPTPLAERQSWHIFLSATGLLVQRDFPRLDLEFAPDAFAGDPRIAAMRWQR